MDIHLHNLLPDFIEPEITGSSQVWNNIIHIEKGQRLHIVANSGRGKTSLIHFLYGIRKDFAGNIEYGEKNIKAFAPEHLAGLRKNVVSIIFQDLKLFPSHTVRENLQVKKTLEPYPAAASIDEMAKALGIFSKLDKLAGTCSYGEQQRIAIIRALQQPFEILLMDEPFSHLDEDNRLKAMELINNETLKRKASLLLADLKVIPFFKADKTIEL